MDSRMLAQRNNHFWEYIVAFLATIRMGAGDSEEDSEEDSAEDSMGVVVGKRKK